MISWIDDRSRRGNFFCQARKQYSHYSNQLISCMCIVYKRNYSQFLSRRGILNIFGKNRISYFSVILCMRFFAKQCSHLWNWFKFWVCVDCSQRGQAGKQYSHYCCVCALYIRWTIHNFYWGGVSSIFLNHMEFWILALLSV